MSENTGEGVLIYLKLYSTHDLCFVSSVSVLRVWVNKSRLQQRQKEASFCLIRIQTGAPGSAHSTVKLPTTLNIKRTCDHPPSDIISSCQSAERPDLGARQSKQKLSVGMSVEDITGEVWSFAKGHDGY